MKKLSRSALAAMRAAGITEDKILLVKKSLENKLKAFKISRKHVMRVNSMLSKEKCCVVTYKKVYTLKGYLSSQQHGGATPWLKHKEQKANA